MSEIKKVFSIIFLHFFLALIGCLIFSYSRTISVELIAPFISSYRFRNGVLLFITYIPALLISGLLIGYALAFSRNATETVDRWSAQLLSYLKGAFLICLVCISAYIILSEGISPFLEGRQEQAIARSSDYSDFIDVAQESLIRGLSEEAAFQISRALQIWPKSREGAQLLDSIQLDISESLGKEIAERNKGLQDDSELIVQKSSGLTVLDALDKAIAAEKTADYYNAHYYAMLAYSLAPSTDPNKTEALRLAKNAWNQISSGSDLLKAEDDKVLYREKMSGYEAIQNKDFLKAYYIFLKLNDQEHESVDGRKDPDVERFLEVSRQGVLESFFFIDETLNMQLFETGRDIFFVMKSNDGSTNSVFIRGLTYTRASGKDMVYLRNFEYARFDRNNTLKYQISVPYVKMYPYTSNDGIVRPELLLKAVNRKVMGVDIIPEVVSGKVPEMETNILRLDIPYKDFNLIVTANKGASAMSLIELIRFVDKADKYGFSRPVYLCELIGRLSDPFLMLIVSIYVLILGWRYRLGKNVLFKAWWLLPLPLFPIFSLFLIETVKYFARRCIIVFVSLVPQSPILLMLSFLALTFAGISVYFFSQRSD